LPELGGQIVCWCSSTHAPPDWTVLA
jgi:hypothetical protein